MKINTLHALDQSLDLLKDTYNYNHWIYSLLRGNLGETICEVGAGTGNLTRFFLEAKRLLCLEPQIEYFDSLQKLAVTHLNLEVCNGDLDFWLREHQGGEFDSVVCVNVLEHIQDDLRAIMQMKEMLKKEGRVILYVPAAPWAYGQLDRALGHHRRYSKRMIMNLAQSGGLEIKKMLYVNFVGIFGWFLHACVLKREVISPHSARVIDRLVPYMSAIEKILPIPVGQSILAIMLNK